MNVEKQLPRRVKKYIESFRRQRQSEGLGTPDLAGNIDFQYTSQNPPPLSCAYQVWNSAYLLNWE